MIAPAFSSIQAAWDFAAEHHDGMGTLVVAVERPKYRWYWRTKLPERHGQICRLLARGKLNSVMIEFEDGVRYITSRYALRKA